MRALQTVDRGIGCFLLREVFSRGLAESGGRFFDVQNVVGDLECPSDGVAEPAQAGDIFGGRRPRTRPTAVIEARISAAVFERWMYSSIWGSTGFPSASMSATWPPTIPLMVPAAAATSVRMAARRSAAVGVAPIVSNARVKSASPARIAIASPNFLWQVGCRGEGHHYRAREDHRGLRSRCGMNSMAHAG